MDVKTYRRMPNLLRKYRRVNGFNQRQAAKLLGFKSSSCISRWENGKRLPSTINLFKLSLLYWTLPEALYIDHVRELRKEIFEKEKEVLEQRSC